MQDNQIILHTGSNLGARFDNLNVAKQWIEKRIGKVINASRYYETAAWGITEQPDFINQALMVETDLPPRALLENVLNIEKEMGRVRGQKWDARLIDIDIIFYNRRIIQEEDLIIPHPYLQQRNFVLAPLMDIIPNFEHPVLALNIETLWEQCSDRLAAIPVYVK